MISNLGNCLTARSHKAFIRIRILKRRPGEVTNLPKTPLLAERGHGSEDGSEMDPCSSDYENPIPGRAGGWIVGWIRMDQDGSTWNSALKAYCRPSGGMDPRMDPCSSDYENPFPGRAGGWILGWIRMDQDGSRWIHVEFCAKILLLAASWLKPCSGCFDILVARI